MKKILKLNNNDELLICSSNKPKTVVMVKDQLMEIIEVENFKTYYKINTTSYIAIKCLSYLTDFMNNCCELKLPKDLQEKLNDLLNFCYDKVYGKDINLYDDVIETSFQCIVSNTKN